jgi:C1A family cysteine protease
MVTVYSDHRNAQSAVRQQGERRACVAFAVAASQEWRRDVDEQLSIEDVLWSAHQVGGPPGREETSVQLALTGLDQHGHAIEAAWPYGEPPWPADRPALAKEPRQQRSPADWHRLALLDFGAVARCLADGLAVVLTVRFVPLAWRDPTGLIDSARGAVVAGGHAVLAVGVADQNDSECLIVKNSWGTWWGQSGYGFMTDRYLTAYGVAGHVIGATS